MTSEFNQKLKGLDEVMEKWRWGVYIWDMWITV
jgi:hypothetical protein